MVVGLGWLTVAGVVGVDKAVTLVLNRLSEVCLNTFTFSHLTEPLFRATYSKYRDITPEASRVKWPRRGIDLATF